MLQCASNNAMLSEIFSLVAPYLDSHTMLLLDIKEHINKVVMDEKLFEMHQEQKFVPNISCQPLGHAVRPPTITGEGHNAGCRTQGN